MRIGKPREPFDRKFSLHDWCNDTGCGIVGYNTPSELPKEMYDFIHSQFERFKIPVLDREAMDNVAGVGAWASYYLIDCYDPYIMLVRGLSDVAWSDVGHTHTIEIKPRWEQRTPEEANPELVEAFVPAPQQAENFFNYAMAHPGLDSLPHELGAEIKMMLFDYYGSPEDFCDGESLHGLQHLCTVDGKIDRVRYNAYFELAAWAALLWFLGPPGKDWRVSNHDVFWLCETEGLAIMYDMTFVPKDHYTIHPRAPQSCCVCGLDSYCVELVHLDGMATFVCEKHLNPEPLYQNATCGSKVCKFAVCPNHPMHGQEDAVYRMLAGNGQIHRLNQSRGGGQPMIAAREQRLIANK